MKEFRDSSGLLLAYWIGSDFPEGLSASSSPNDYVQLLTWRYNGGKRLGPHAHKRVERSADYTQECVVVVSGRMQADIFDTQRGLVASVEVHAGECLVLLAGAHGYEILDNDTKVLEIKNGPYPGAQADRETFTPDKK